MKVSISLEYIPFSQHAYCCVPTVLQMILYRRAIPLISQEDIGNELGLIVPENDKHMFNKVRTGPRPSAGYGTQAHKSEFSINSFFDKNNLPLRETVYGIENIKDVKKFIIDNLNEGNDLIVCFNYKALYDAGGACGHVSLLSSFDGETTVTLIDPENDVPKYREVKLSKLIIAMKHHGKDKGGGFWIISSKLK